MKDMPLLGIDDSRITVMTNEGKQSYIDFDKNISIHVLNGGDARFIPIGMEEMRYYAGSTKGQAYVSVAIHRSKAVKLWMYGLV